MNKGILWVLLMLCCNNLLPHYEVHINGSSSSHHQPQSLLLQVANTAISGFTAVCVVGSCITSWLGRKKKQDNNPPPIQQQRPNHGNPHINNYYYAGVSRSYGIPAPSRPEHVARPQTDTAYASDATKQQHLHRLAECQDATLHIIDQEWDDELHDYELHQEKYNRLARRKKALHALKEAPHYTNQHHAVPNKALRLMHEKKLEAADYQTCYGNQLQQTLHEEVLTIITQTADLYYTNNYVHDMPLTELLVDFTDLGRVCNQSGHMLKALTTLDACWQILDCVSAVCEGIGLGIWNIAVELSNPVMFAKNIVVGTAMLAYYLAIVARDVGDLGVTYCYDADLAASKYHTACAQIDAVYDAIRKKIQETPTRDLLKHGACFATECYLSGKALASIGSFYGKAKQQALHLHTIIGDGIKDWSRVVTTPEGFTMRIADKTATILNMAAETVGDFTGKVVRTAAQISPELPALLDLERRVAHLKKLFDGTKNMLADLKGVESLTFNFEHILGLEIVDLYKKGLCIKNRLSGFHHDVMGKLEQSGLVRYVKQKIGPCGSFFGDVVLEGKTFEGKSFFPPSWSDEKVIEKILESLQNLCESTLLQSNGNLCLVGMTWEKTF